MKRLPKFLIDGEWKEVDVELLLRQNKAMADALRGVGQCKSIAEVRKVLTHAREVYPKR